MRKALVLAMVLGMLAMVYPAPTQATTCTGTVLYDAYLINAQGTPPPMVHAGEVLYNVQTLNVTRLALRKSLVLPWLYFDGTDQQPALYGYVPTSAVTISCQ